MAPKERTKGKKEIHKENVETVHFYRKFSLAGTAAQVGHCLLFYFLSAEFSIPWNAFFCIFAVVVHLVCHKLLSAMARPTLGGRGELLEAGTDLSSSFISEYIIDIIILTALIQGTSLLSNYFWLFWLLAPAYIFYKLWVTLLWPWFKSGSPDPPSGAEGKKKKTKQKFRRY